jgi:hypothetical protein
VKIFTILVSANTDTTVRIRLMESVMVAKGLATPVTFLSTITDTIAIAVASHVVSTQLTAYIKEPRSKVCCSVFGLYSHSMHQLGKKNI